MMARSVLAASTFLALAAVGTAAPAEAATVSTVYGFDGANGVGPRNGTLLLSGGTIYAATYAGGTNDQGAVTAITGGAATLLHAFDGTDGAHPNGSLVADAAGNLYGTTQAGGTAGLGTIFKLTKPVGGASAWSFTLLHAFAGTADGAGPIAGLSFGPDGALYGTAVAGGDRNGGTVYRITTTGTFRRLYSFGTDVGSGLAPATNVVVDSTGNVIGTTSGGQTEIDGGGNLFRISPNGSFTVVAEFSSRGPLHTPVGTIVRDGNGSIYGMAAFSGQYPYPPTGGAIFKVAAVTHTTSLLTTLGTAASSSGVALVGSGTLYYTLSGATLAVGAVGTGTLAGPGSVYTLPTSGGTPTLVATLDYRNLLPVGPVVADAAGNLFGQSSTGGTICAETSNATQSGCGTIYEVKP